MSDTGGGHRAAAEAIRDTMLKLYGADAVQIELVDAFRDYFSPPFQQAAETYTWTLTNFKIGWALMYRLMDTRITAWIAAQVLYASSWMKLHRMYREHPADVIVNVHSVLGQPTLTALRQVYGAEHPPYITVVTDLVTTPVLWYDKRVDLTCVPTAQAYARGLHAGLSPERMIVTGLPVHPRFTEPTETRLEARRALEWDETLPAILMVAGSDGTGPMYETAQAINALSLPCQLIVIAGRNTALKTRLEALNWNQPTHIYGYRTDMPRLMRAASILVTKAGPATLMEACTSGLPPIISDAIPGQEDGNVIYILEHQAGAFAPSPEEVASVVKAWVNGGETKLRLLSERARKLAKPDAAEQIARQIWAAAQGESSPTRQAISLQRRHKSSQKRLLKRREAMFNAES